MPTVDPVQDAIRRLEQKFNELGSRLTQRVYNLEQRGCDIEDRFNQFGVHISQRTHDLEKTIKANPGRAERNPVQDLADSLERRVCNLEQWACGLEPESDLEPEKQPEDPIKPCPFCGFEHRYIRVLASESSRRWRIQCPQCKAEGPITDVGEAIDAWNNRYQQEDSE